MVGGGGATKCHVLGVLVSDVFDCNVGCVVHDWRCVVGRIWRKVGICEVLVFWESSTMGCPQYNPIKDKCP